MRYVVKLSYRGTHFSGWQKQPGDKTIQETVEQALSTLLRQETVVVGCGRTDAGVHARNYVAHFDASAELDLDRLRHQANAILPPDIALQYIVQGTADFHARYDARYREYVYYVHFDKDPFRQGTSLYYSYAQKPDPALMYEACAILLSYDTFKPFCKTGSDAAHFRCKLMKADWIFTEHEARFTIRANRFLRGMVRLIVGAMLQIGQGKITLDEFKQALEKQVPLTLNWSVPADGLFLEQIDYPEKLSFIRV